MKTSTKLLIAFCAIVVLSVTGFMVMARLMIFSSVTNRKYVEKTIELKLQDFNGIDVSQAAKVFLIQGDKYNVKITGDQQLLTEVSTEIEDSILKIRFPRIMDNSQFTLEITAPEFKSIKTAAAVQIETKNILKGDRLTMDMGTGSSGEFDLQYNAFKCDANTGCLLTLKGQATKAALNVNTGSKVNALDFQVKDCKVNGSTGVEIEISVSDLLSADLSTGSTLSYKGNPSIKSVNTSTGSEIKKLF